MLEIECVNASTNTFENKKDHEIFHCPPRNISKSQTETIINTALKAYKVLNAKDYARIDIIIAKDGTPYFLELNTFPGLHMKSGNERNLHSSYIGTMAKAIGLGNSDVYKHIIDIASERLCLYE